ncbi:MAG TPA: polysaccharide biosynthesis C-terminal domain-containing protein [Gemmatimonadales bacterium]|nr:polysaccharide biosynthesis C-terminal domain-containing protein [Gemmatimonadales bacterium]
MTARSRVVESSAAANVLWNWGTFAFTVATTFFISPYVVKSLGNTTYGLWVLLGSLVGYLGLLDFGVRGAVTRYVARFHADANDEQAGRLTSTALRIFSLMGLAAVVVTVLLATTIIHRFNITPAENATARLVLTIGGLTVAAALVGGVYGGVVIGLERFDLNGMLEIGIGIVRVLGIYFALKLGYGILSLALIQFGVSAARTTGMFWYSRRLYPELRVRFTAWDSEAFRQIFSFSAYSTLLLFSSSLILYSDSVVIGAFLPIGLITYFAIAGNLVDYTRALVRGISTTLTPRASALEASDPGRLAAVILRAARLATLLILPIVVTFLLRGARFIDIWMGPAYGHEAGRILVILTVSLAFSASTQVTLSALMGLSRHKEYAPFNIAEAVINLGLSIYWVRSFGIAGVALGTMVPSLVSSMVVMPWYVHRHVGISPMQFALNAWVRPFVALVPFAVATAFLDHYWVARGLVSYFAGVLLVLPLALAGSWRIAFDEADRDLVRRFLPFLPGSRRAQPAAGPEVGVVAMVPDVWGGPWMPRHHILTRLADHFPVVWVDPPQGWRGSWQGGSPWLHGNVKEHPEFTILRWPPDFLYRERPAVYRNWLLRFHLRRAIRMLRQRGVRRVVLYLWRPEFAFALRYMPYDFSCYHIDDEYTFAAEERPLSGSERHVLESVDQVILHSPALLEKKGGINPHTLFVPNGADYSAYATPVAEPADLAAIPHPRIGYVGVIKDQLDFGLLLTLARRHSEWSWVMVGPLRAGSSQTADIDALQLLPNVHFLGGKPVTELPAYMQHLDVCLLCYVQSGYTKFIYPMKLHEYLATGRPVVGTPIRSLLEFKNVVRLASTPDEWSRAIADGLAHPEVGVEERLAVARAHDWATLAERVAQVFSKDLPERPRYLTPAQFRSR